MGSSALEKEIKTLHRELCDHPFPRLWWDPVPFRTLYSLIEQQWGNPLTMAWPGLGEREIKALSWLGCRSLENSVLVDPCQGSGIEGLPVNKHSNPEDSQRSKSPWHSVETSTQSEELLLLKTYVQIVQQSKAEVSK